MDEISNVLEPKEKALWSGKPRFGAFIANYVVFAVILAAILAFIFPLAIPLAVLLIVYGVLTYKVTQYAITSKRIILQSGIIGRDFKFVEYDKMQNVGVDVGVMDKIFGTGSVRIFSGEIGSKYQSGSSFKVGGRTVTTGGSYAPTPVYDIIAHITNPYDILKILNQNLSRRKEASTDILKSIEGILKKRL